MPRHAQIVKKGCSGLCTFVYKKHHCCGCQSMMLTALNHRWVAAARVPHEKTSSCPSAKSCCYTNVCSTPKLVKFESLPVLCPRLLHGLFHIRCTAPACIHPGSSFPTRISQFKAAAHARFFLTKSSSRFDSGGLSHRVSPPVPQ